MVNNNFEIIGVATSNYQDVSSPTSNFTKYKFEIEIEKTGSKQGNTMKLAVEVYGTNRAVDIHEAIIGRRMAVNGYIDSYFKNKSDEATIKLVAQAVMLLDDKKNIAVNVAPVKEEAKEEEIEEVVESVDVPDDELPF